MGNVRSRCRRRLISSRKKRKGPPPGSRDSPNEIRKWIEHRFDESFVEIEAGIIDDSCRERKLPRKSEGDFIREIL